MYAELKEHNEMYKASGLEYEKQALQSCASGARWWDQNDRAPVQKLGYDLGIVTDSYPPLVPLFPTFHHRASLPFLLWTPA